MAKDTPSSNPRTQASFHTGSVQAQLRLEIMHITKTTMHKGQEMKLNHRDISRAIDLELESIDPNDYYRHSDVDDELVSTGRPVKRIKVRAQDEESNLKQRHRK